MNVEITDSVTEATGIYLCNVENGKPTYFHHCCVVMHANEYVTYTPQFTFHSGI